MITPPYHFSIISSSPFLYSPHQYQSTSSNNNNSNTGIKENDVRSETLYRGSIPSSRNKTFIKRLNLRTVVVLRKKQLKEDDQFMKWSVKNGINLKWVKADEMGEEKLGMGKNEVSEVLKIILDTKSYPLYIADLDGISHTTLIVACLRKLQGWNMDCIINEISRFEPEYQDLSILPFIQSYLSPTTTSSSSSSSQPDLPFILPNPPYPTFLWPPTSSTTSSSTSSNNQPTKLRDRSTSTTTTSNSNSINSSSSNSGLPFPHPLMIRKHPTMKITFPMLPPPPPSQSNTMTSGGGGGGGGMISPQPLSSPTLSSTYPGGLSRVNSRREKTSLPPIPSSSAPASGAGIEDYLNQNTNNNNVLGQAVNTLHSNLSGITNIISGMKDSKDTSSAIKQDMNLGNKDKDKDKLIDGLSNDGNKLGRTVSFHSISEKQSQSPQTHQTQLQENNSKSEYQTSTVSIPPPLPQPQRQFSNSSSPLKLSRQPTITTPSSDQYISESNDGEEDEEEGGGETRKYVSEYQDDDDEYYEDDNNDDEEEDDDEEDDEDDEDDEDGNEPTSQYISALDLAGFG